MLLRVNRITSMYRGHWRRRDADAFCMDGSARRRVHAPGLSAVARVQQGSPSSIGADLIVAEIRSRDVAAASHADIPVLDIHAANAFCPLQYSRGITLRPVPQYMAAQTLDD